jgi:hypothetical protein|nr:MAG TPA: hypothetical protein [Caudoviricetes sp.]
MVTLQTFKLCKQLHELKPDWIPEDRLFIRREGDNPEIVKDPKFVYRFDEAPRFTVDYLLEKLPKRAALGFEYGMLTLSTRQGAFRNGWMAFYDDGAGYPLGGIDGVAETALDALLELTIEMAERTEI